MLDVDEVPDGQARLERAASLLRAVDHPALPGCHGLRDHAGSPALLLTGLGLVPRWPPHATPGVVANVLRHVAELLLRVERQRIAHEPWCLRGLQPSAWRWSPTRGGLVWSHVETVGLLGQRGVTATTWFVPQLATAAQRVPEDDVLDLARLGLALLGARELADATPTHPRQIAGFTHALRGALRQHEVPAEVAAMLERMTTFHLDERPWLGEVEACMADHACSDAELARALAPGPSRPAQPPSPSLPQTAPAPVAPASRRRAQPPVSLGSHRPGQGIHAQTRFVSSRPGSAAPASAPADLAPADTLQAPPSSAADAPVAVPAPSQGPSDTRDRGPALILGMGCLVAGGLTAASVLLLALGAWARLG